MSNTALTLTSVSRHYGVLKAVDEVTLEVAAGSRHALIGPNGAGKSTLFSVICGAVPATSGSILLGGKDITTWSEHKRVTAGLACTLQHSSLFDGLSVIDNVALAVQRRTGSSARFWKSSISHHRITSQAEKYISDVGLTGRARDVVGSLSHGERRQLEVAVILATEPKVLLLDEPTAGMSISESDAFVRLIQNLSTDVTIVIVEHDLDVVFQLADRVTVLHAGQILSEGTPEQVRANSAVQVAYLGVANSSDLFLNPTDCEPVEVQHNV